MSRSLVLAHGGSLTAESEGTGKGSRFVVVLPTTTATTASGMVECRPLAAARHGGLNILLVEDHEDTAQTLRESLVARGHRVRVAGSIDAALREAAADQCALLISDIGLPDGTGVDLLRRLHPTPTIGAIAMSGFGMEDDLRRSREAGFARHLTKPVDLALLEETIADLASGSVPPDGSAHCRE